MILGAPQLIILVLYVLSIGVSLAVHGKERTGKHSFFTSLITTIVEFGILYWGGFFS